MAVAASVKTTIVVKGRDEASRAIKKSQQSVGKLKGAMDSAQASASRMGGALRQVVSGDVGGAFSSLSAAVGSGGLGASMAAATAGTAAFVVAATAAAFKTVEWAEEVERLRAQMRFAFGGEGEQQALALAGAIGGVTAESVAKLASTIRGTGVLTQFTTAQLQELGNRAAAAGQTGDTALEALNRTLKTGTTRALQQVGVYINSGKVLDDYAKSVNKTTTELTQLERQEAVASAVSAELSNSVGATTNAHQRLDRTLADVSNAILSLKLRISELVAGPAGDWINAMTDGIKFAERWGESIFNLVRTAVVPFDVGIRVALASFNGFIEVMQSFAESGVTAKTGDVIKQVGIDIAKAANPVKAYADLWESVNRAIDGPKGAKTSVLGANSAIKSARTIFDNAKAAAFGLFATVVNGADESGKSAARFAANLKKTIGKGFDKKADEKRSRSRSRATARRLKDARDESAAHTDMLAILKEHDTELSKIDATRHRIAVLAAQGDPMASAKVANLQVQRDLLAEIARIQATTLSVEDQRRAIDAAAGVAKIQQVQNIASAEKVLSDMRTQAAQKEAAEIKRVAAERQRARNAAIANAFDVAKSGVAAAEAIGVASRVVAGVRAAIATGEMFMALTRYDFAAAGNALAAAVTFGKVAFSSPPSPTASPMTSSGPTGGGIQRPASSGEGSAPAFNIVINGVMTTRAEVGAAIDTALKAAAGAGMAGATP